MATRFNVLAIVQRGRLQAEALLWLASFRAFNPDPDIKVFFAEPAPGPLWPRPVGIDDPDARALFAKLGAELIRFESRAFGASYPYGNKIEALAALPPDIPFLFTDTDTLWRGPVDAVPFDFDRPSASLRRSGTWPRPRDGGPDRAAIWGSLYDMFGLDFASAQDARYPSGNWRRYLYFNAGFFFYRCPRVFGARLLDYAIRIRDSPPAELEGQALDPWLDQVALPLVVHALGGGFDTLEDGWMDGRTSLHYRTLPLLYARESDEAVTLLEEIAAPNRIKKLLKTYRPFHRMLYRGDGARVRALFSKEERGMPEQKIRKRIRAEGLWLR